MIELISKLKSVQLDKNNECLEINSGMDIAYKVNEIISVLNVLFENLPEIDNPGKFKLVEGNADNG